MSSQNVKSNKSTSEKKVVKKHTSKTNAKSGKSKTPKRTFKVYDEKTGKSHGRYTSTNPKQAARKASRRIFKKLVEQKESGEFNGKIPTSINFCIKESGQQSNKKFYSYTGTVTKLHKPLERNIVDKDGKVTKIVYKHEYNATKKPLPEKLRLLQEEYMQKKKDKKKREEKKKKKEENKKEGKTTKSKPKAKSGKSTGKASSKSTGKATSKSTTKASSKSTGKKNK